MDSISLLLVLGDQQSAGLALPEDKKEDTDVT